MENEVVTEDVVVEHVAKNLILEQVAVSGVLIVTVDSKLLYTKQFKNQVKVQIVLDNDVDEIKKDSHLHSVDSPGNEAGEDSANEVDLDEDEDTLIDDALSLKFGATSTDAINSQRLEPARANDPPMKETSSTSKPSSISKKAIQLSRMSKKDFNVKPVTNISSKIKETEKVELVDDNSEVDYSDSDQETSLKNDDLGSSKVVSCPYCNKSFKNQTELSFHRKVERQFFPCPICQRVFGYKAYLMVHLRDRHQETSPKVDPSKSESVVSDGKSEQCEICGSVFSSLNNLKLHLMSHTSEFAYRCCICPEQMRTRNKYEKHMAKHSKLGHIQCKICKLRVNTRGELSRHQLTHPVSCGLCGQVFPNKTGRYFHYKTVHKNDILKCPQCERLYSCKKALDKHLKYHRNRHQTQCPVCGLFFFRLREHMVSHASEQTDGEHVESMVFVCDKCPKQFNKKKSFDRHIKIHSEEKLYTCTECSKQFYDSRGLKRHLIVHLQEKPYVCDVCGKACSQKGNLRVHMQIHKADRASKSLQCSHCGANFTQKNTLQEHIDKEHRFEENVLQFPQQYFQMNTFYHG